MPEVPGTFEDYLPTFCFSCTGGGECLGRAKGGGAKQRGGGGAKPRKDGLSETIFGDPPKTVFEGVT